MRTATHRGFSLVELMIVLAIILVIAALAIPALIQARLAANEASAVGAIRVIVRAEVTYTLAFKSGYSQDLYSLGPTSGAAPSTSRADLVDPIIAGPAPGSTGFTRQGYAFTYTPKGTFPGIKEYTLTAVPVIPGSTGKRRFYADQTLVIRANATAPAGPKDTPIPN